ncbi:MAG: sigma-70 family RNA polymerase sigma factor [Clostridia bacterium]|nr:sigma-70 family RNA polymerase sigma factor [Clostridia bacterium]
MHDSEIITMLWNRQQRALSEITLKYGRLLFSLCENILHCKEDSRECVNDTYLAVWNRIPPEKPDPLTAFLCRIARNISIKKLRDRNALKRQAETLPIHELEYCIAGTSVEDKVDAKVLGKKIDEFLSSMDEESRVIFVRRYFFGDDIETIMSLVGMSESNVYKRLSRTRKKLKAYLEKEGVFDA